MKKILDANYFQNPALEEYLNANKNNKVVFTEDACMEAYKGNTLKNICRSIEIVSKHPEQVVVLRQAREIIKLQGVSNDQQCSLRTLCRHAGSRISASMFREQCGGTLYCKAIF